MDSLSPRGAPAAGPRPQPSLRVKDQQPLDMWCVDKHQNKGRGWRKPRLPLAPCRQVRCCPEPGHPCFLPQVRVRWGGTPGLGDILTMGAGKGTSSGEPPPGSKCQWTGVRHGPSNLWTSPGLSSQNWGAGPPATPEPLHPPPQRRGPRQAAEPSPAHNLLSSGQLRHKEEGPRLPSALCDP